MDTILNAVCVLVTAAFALALVPGFKQAERSLLARLDQGTALLAFLVLGLVEEGHCFARRLTQRTNRGGMRGWSDSGSLGGTGPSACLLPG